MKFRFLIAFIFISLFATAQQIKSPSEFLGYELGTRFSRHHQVVSYYKYLEDAVPEMVQLKSYGSTNEGRELLLAFVSTAENLSNLENIRLEHLKALDGNSESKKALVWFSYNVHGNESVSSEASMKTIYEILTSKKEYLTNTVVIMDPSVNPDGRDRYVNWYNSYKNTPYNIDVNSKEHHEPWLSGRPNHYMFDLNRDWAWVTQKESKQRLAVYNEWLPHIHVDFHEQSMDNPYYFAPAAEPMHEVITKWQRDFQVAIGKNHAKYFDENGWFYFTKEVFDLLYPSYGDTYPIYSGSIGMTYEQGGSGRAGLGVKIKSGDTLTLKDRIAHHFTTGISTLEMASKNTDKLNKQFSAFYANKDFTYNSYALSGDIDKIKALTSLLDVHKIKYGFTTETVKGLHYNTKENGSLKGDNPKLVVSTNQPKSTLVTVLFEPETKLTDSLTYDITAWSLPYAYGLEAVASKNTINTNSESLEYPSLDYNSDSYAYVTDWNSMDDARFLTELLSQKIQIRYASEPFTIDEKSYGRGSLIITKSDNTKVKDFNTIMKNAATKHHKILTSTTTGFVSGGKDFGSSAVHIIPNIKVAALSGGSVATLNFGEVWHFFEQQLHYPITVIDNDYINSTDLSKYDVLIIPELSKLEKGKLEKIKKWTHNGGKLIAIGDAIKVLDNDDDFDISANKAEEENDSIQKPESYISSKREYIKKMITGAIYKAKVDNTHPLSYGYEDTYYTLKLSGNAYKFLKSKNAVYIENNAKPLAGFAGSDAQKQQANSLVLGSENMGKGKVIYMVDNPLFRGFWENGKLFFVNALFMVE
ncbi:zinc carboxypeptidase [Joostella atrarenae]|uniref:Zinc carboxypeptidase n=1 Tax=Joostella atrarenae TaxID=679257 RepID=A0ABS9J2U2_9FLAO|nr:M14 family metallopeptidase [Joostella atrarenae]MCF8714742.1 zinc carboxypeptidase [Joostella atrarenae]